MHLSLTSPLQSTSGSCIPQALIEIPPLVLAMEKTETPARRPYLVHRFGIDPRHCDQTLRNIAAMPTKATSPARLISALPRATIQLMDRLYTLFQLRILMIRFRHVNRALTRLGSTDTILPFSGPNGRRTPSSSSLLSIHFSAIALSPVHLFTSDSTPRNLGSLRQRLQD